MLFDSLYAEDKKQFELSADSTTSVIEGMGEFYDYDQQVMMYVGMFTMDVMKYSYYNIQLNSDNPEFEITDVPNVPNGKIVIVKTEHEDYKYLHFGVSKYGEHWYISAPMFRTEKKKMN
jgi:hypothetical protein